MVNNQCHKFKSSRCGLQDMSPALLNEFFRKIMPDEAFRFITFQAGDFRSGNITVLLYNYVPESVPVTLDNVLDTVPALDALEQLNPGTTWDELELQYFEWEISGHASINIELQLTEIPMRVNSDGMLLWKLR